jgi:aminoglycoside phosphotransferase (APT) family kinase protein
MSDDIKQKLFVELQQQFAPEKIINLLELENHTVNTLFSFTKNNEGFFVKVLTRPPASEHEVHRLKKEVDLYKQFQELKKVQGIDPNQLINVPVPEVIYYEADESKIGYRYYIMNKIPGNSLEEIKNKITLKQKKNFFKKFASIVRGIHSISFEMFGEIEEYDCPRQFYSMKSMLKADARRCARLLGKNKLLPIKLVTKTQTFIEKRLDEVQFCEIPKLVHTDLFPPNVIAEVSNDKIQINGIIDFEWSYAGDPIFDLIAIEYNWRFEEKLSKLFFQKYSQGEISNLDQYSIEKQIFHAIETLKTVALGWVYFHPTVENLTYMENRLKEIMEEE